MLLLATCLSLYMLTSVNAAGMTSHNVIARRAMEYERYQGSEDKKRAFEGLSRDRIDAIQGGAPWPDYLYACGEDHNAGEVRFLHAGPA